MFILLALLYILIVIFSNIFNSILYYSIFHGPEYFLLVIIQGVAKFLINVLYGLEQ